MQKQGYKSKTIPFLPAHSIYGLSKKNDIWTIKKYPSEEAGYAPAPRIRKTIPFF